jgi:LytS/YehU family sensor histidine kinase
LAPAAEGPPRCAAILSEILRYSLESSRHEKISLGHELSIIAKYIAVVGVQFEERLRFEMRIPQELHEALVPPMVLQMLVKNAIKHGLEHLSAGGALSLEAAQESARLAFKVANDAPAQARKQPGIGLGLRNIAQRLELLYGSRASIDVTASERRFCVQLALPMERAA